MSVLLAKIFGLYFLAVGITFLFNSEKVKKICESMLKDENVLFLSGLFGILFGAFVISAHNIWILEWFVAITILGWWSYIKGVALLAYPNFKNLFTFMNNKSKGFYQMVGVFYLILAVFFAYYGWAIGL